MNPDFVIVPREVPLRESIRLLFDAIPDRLVVLDKVGRPIGIVSAPEALRRVHARGD